LFFLNIGGKKAKIQKDAGRKALIMGDYFVPNDT